MTTNLIRLSACLATAMLLTMVSPQAYAGRTCEDKPLSVQAVEQGMHMAEKTARALDANGAQVVVLARAGQDLSKYGLNYSHLGLAYRVDDASGSRWRVVHKLNHCGTDRAGLYRQGLGEFFMDNPHRYEAAWVVPTPELQNRLLPLLQSNQQLLRFHEPRYSMVSYVWSQTYQQSNQWVIEVLATALAVQVNSRAQAQSVLASHMYTPTTLHLGTFTRLGARVAMANVAFDDHPDHLRFSGRIQTVGADGVFQWMRRRALSGEVTRVWL